MIKIEFIAHCVNCWYDDISALVLYVTILITLYAIIKQKLFPMQEHQRRRRRRRRLLWQQRKWAHYKHRCPWGLLSSCLYIWKFAQYRFSGRLLSTKRFSIPHEQQVSVSSSLFYLKKNLHLVYKIKIHLPNTNTYTYFLTLKLRTIFSTQIFHSINILSMDLNSQKNLLKKAAKKHVLCYILTYLHKYITQCWGCVGC